MLQVVQKLWCTEDGPWGILSRSVPGQHGGRFHSIIDGLLHPDGAPAGRNGLLTCRAPLFACGCRAAAREHLAALPVEQESLNLEFHHPHLEQTYEYFLNSREARRDKVVGVCYALVLLGAFQSGGMPAVLLSGKLPNRILHGQLGCCAWDGPMSPVLM